MDCMLAKVKIDSSKQHELMFSVAYKTTGVEGMVYLDSSGVCCEQCYCPTAEQQCHARPSNPATKISGIPQEP